MNEDIPLPDSEYSSQLKFIDDTEKNLFEKARRTDGFLFDFEVEDIVNYNEPMKRDEIVFLISGCQKLIYRLRSQLSTWLPMVQHYYFVVDKPIANLSNVVVIDQYSRKSSNRGPDEFSSDLDSGERQWRSILWLQENKPELLAKVKWIALINDETWMNVPKLLDFLSNYNHNYNVAIGQVFHELFIKNRTFLQGGGGIVFSRTAFLAVAKQLFNPYCRYNKPHADLSLSSCYKIAGTLLVHSNLFHQWSIGYEKLFNCYLIMPQFYVNQISFHYINNHMVKLKMSCDSAYYWGYEEPQDCLKLKKITNNSLYLELPNLTNLKYTFFEKKPSEGGVENEYLKQGIFAEKWW